MNSISRRKFIVASASVLSGGVCLSLPNEADANDDSEFSGTLNIPPSAGVHLKAVYFTSPYRWNAVRETSWKNGDDIELYFRFPRTAKTASFYAPAGVAALAARVTKKFGGLSFRPEPKGNNWEFKAVFGWAARIAFGAGYAPRYLSNVEASRFMNAYKIRYTR